MNPVILASVGSYWLQYENSMGWDFDEVLRLVNNRWDSSQDLH